MISAQTPKETAGKTLGTLQMGTDVTNPINKMLMAMPVPVIKRIFL
jgi:hypothetical protein